MTDVLDEVRAALREQARMFIVHCEPPCDGCEFEVEQAMAALARLLDAYALAELERCLDVWQPECPGCLKRHREGHEYRCACDHCGWISAERARLGASPDLEE